MIETIEEIHIAVYILVSRQKLFYVEKDLYAWFYKILFSLSIT